MQASVKSTPVYAQGPQPADIFREKRQNDCNLLYVTNKHVLKKISWSNCQVYPSWFRAC